MPSSPDLSQRQKSPPALYRALVKTLCELHPWGQAQLCRAIGMDPTALSNFLGGRRPFSKKYAAAFVSQIGLTLDLQLDPSHCFVLAPGLGMGKLEAELILQLFPNGGEMMELSSVMYSQGLHTRVQTAIESFGVALHGGGFTAVVHGNGHARWIQTTGKWTIRKQADSSSVDLLRFLPLPTKDEVVAEFAKAGAIDPGSWDDVIAKAVDLGLKPYQVLEVLSKVDT